MSGSRREFRDAPGEAAATRALERPTTLKGRDLLGIADLTAEELAFLIDLADEVKAHPGSYWTALEHRSLALLFEKRSNLHWAEVKRRLIKSAVADEFTWPCWNERWGYGKIDVERLLSVEPD